MAIDWIELLTEARKRAGGLIKTSRKLASGYQGVTLQQTTTGALEPKICELIAIAVAVTTRCDSCIASHASAARKAGATEAELADTLAITIGLNAGAAYAYSGRAFEAFTQFKSE